MIFTLMTAKDYFDQDEKAQYEKMGFNFLKLSPESSLYEEEYTVDNSKFPKLIFDSIEALKEWSEAFGQSLLIIDFEDMTIHLYDDYNE